MILQHARDSFFVRGAQPVDAPRLLDLGWRRHPSAPDAWWTASPYLAAPLWGLRDPQDAGLAQALGRYAWNYETSFAKAPLVGTGVDNLRVPTDRVPFDFQIAGVQRMMLRKKVILADSMGLGKTYQALCVLNLTRPRRALIGCPTFLTENWADEAQRCLVDAQPITILSGSRKTLPDSGLVILPYSRAHVFEKQLAVGPPFDAVILDEAHFLKDHLSRRGASFLAKGGVADRAGRVMALTGTPMPNNPVELWGLLRVLAPDVMTLSRDRFQADYCSTFDLPMKNKRIKAQKITGKSLAALNAELRASGVMVRREKEQVLDQLPAKSVYLVHMTPDGEIESLVRQEADLFEMLQTRILPARELMNLRGHIASVRSRLGLLKAPKIVEFARWIMESGEDRIVIFMLHLQAIEAVRAGLSATGVECLRLTGADNPSLRKQRVDYFQTPGGRRAIVAQVTAAGVGLTMTAARYVVLGEISWTPAWNDQAIDRCHRIGQNRAVMAPVVTFPHGVEEKVIRTTARKALDARAVLDDNLQRMFLEAAE